MLIVVKEPYVKIGFLHTIFAFKHVVPLAIGVEHQILIRMPPDSNLG